MTRSRTPASGTRRPERLETMEETMHYEPASILRPTEVHRFFPEWADRPESSGPLLESDHNSYLAGGYSEEFGYRVRSDRPTAFTILREDPDRSRQWAVQIDGLHPGYPECPRPADRAGASTTGLANPPTGRILATGARSAEDAGSRPSLTRVIRVARRGAERRFVLLGAPFGTLWAKLRIRSHIRDRGL